MLATITKESMQYAVWCASVVQEVVGFEHAIAEHHFDSLIDRLMVGFSEEQQFRMFFAMIEEHELVLRSYMLLQNGCVTLLNLYNERPDEEYAQVQQICADVMLQGHVFAVVNPLSLVALGLHMRALCRAQSAIIQKFYQSRVASPKVELVADEESSIDSFFSLDSNVWSDNGAVDDDWFF